MAWLLATPISDLAEGASGSGGWRGRDEGRLSRLGLDILIEDGGVIDYNI